MAIIVIGCHSGGTSLVSSICDALGVNMNPNPKAKVKWYLNYEDADFVRLNVQILKKLGAGWKKPPTWERVIGYRDKGFFDKKIKKLIAKRSGLWGFKDPRTALTIPIIHPHLPEPKYIRVIRPIDKIADSLMSRGSGNVTRDRWLKLANEYNDHIQRFLGQTESEILPVSFCALLNKKMSQQEVERIREFVGCGDVGKALKRIKYERK